jgi:hypothetical protein
MNESNLTNPIKDIKNIQIILENIKNNNCKTNNCFNELNALSFYVGDYNVKSMIKKKDYYGLISYDKNYNFELKYSPHYL